MLRRVTDPVTTASASAPGDRALARPVSKSLRPNLSTWQQHGAHNGAGGGNHSNGGSGGRYGASQSYY